MQDFSRERNVCFIVSGASAFLALYLTSILNDFWWIFVDLSKVPKYGGFFGPYFPVFGLNAGKYRSEKTPYLDTFHEVAERKFSFLFNYKSCGCFIDLVYFIVYCYSQSIQTDFQNHDIFKYLHFSVYFCENHIRLPSRFFPDSLPLSFFEMERLGTIKLILRWIWLSNKICQWLLWN